MLSNNKILGKCWYGGHPWIRLAMESESMVEKGINSILCLGTAYDISSMESIGNYSVFFVDRKSMPHKMFYLFLFLRNSEIGKKQQFWAGLSVNRLVPKII